MTDPRYRTTRWKNLARHVIARDGRVCSVPYCTSDMTLPRMAQADHITEAKDHLTDAEFWDPNGIQVLCRPHNLEKGLAAKVRRADRAQITSPNA